MPLHYTRDGYTFRSNAQGLTIEPGPKSITLTRPELEQVGLEVRDDYQIPLVVETEKEDPTEGILSTLHQSILRCRLPEEAWMVQNLKRAMVLIGGLDEGMVQQILDQEGV